MVAAAVHTASTKYGHIVLSVTTKVCSSSAYTPSASGSPAWASS